ncbi:MAG: hypothetical protein V4515_03540 [Chloroflexota bacterium]
MSSPSTRSSGRSSGPRRSNAGSGRKIGPFAITPIRIILALGFLGALAYLAWATVKVRDSTQIPMVTTGLGVLALLFAVTSAGGAVRMWQAWKHGDQAQTLLFAILGGIAGMLALGSFAGMLVLSLVWGS